MFSSCSLWLPPAHGQEPGGLGLAFSGLPCFPWLVAVGLRVWDPPPVPAAFSFQPPFFSQCEEGSVEPVWASGCLCQAVGRTPNGCSEGPLLLPGILLVAGTCFGRGSGTWEQGP